jgi:hypothetical protein
MPRHEGSKALLQDYFYAAESRARDLNSKQVSELVTKRLGTPAAPNPSRRGVSYMNCAYHARLHCRACTCDYEHAGLNVLCTRHERRRHRWPWFRQAASVHPDKSPGRDDYIILRVGETEKAKSLEDSKELLRDLYSYRNYLCIASETRSTPVDKGP